MSFLELPLEGRRAPISQSVLQKPGAAWGGLGLPKSQPPTDGHDGRRYSREVPAPPPEASEESGGGKQVRACAASALYS